MGHEGLKEVFEEAEVECFDLAVRQIDVVHEEWPAAEIDGDSVPMFHPACRSEAESLDAGLFPRA